MASTNGHKSIPVSDVVYREDLYPRLKADPATIQRYAENLDILPAIEINQHNELIDGYHRWTAHRKVGAETIPVTITKTTSDVELLALACQRNAAHGLQLSDPDKRKMAVRLYASGTGMSKDEIAATLSVSQRSVSGYLSDVDSQLRSERRDKIVDMWQACYTQEEIAGAVRIPQQTIADELKDLPKLEELPKSVKLAAAYQDDFEPELYDIWNFDNSEKYRGKNRWPIIDGWICPRADPNYREAMRNGFRGSTTPYRALDWAALTDWRTFKQMVVWRMSL